MRSRDMGFEDYGMTESEVDKVLHYCQTNTEKSNSVLLKCAMQSNPYISADLFYSLSQNISYDRLDAIKSIAYSKNDFYAYRRKTIALVKACTTL